MTTNTRGARPNRHLLFLCQRDPVSSGSAIPGLNGAGRLSRSDLIRNSFSASPKSQITVPRKSELRVAIAAGLRAQSRLSGTEFLDAETKRQKSPLKCASAYRDQNPGSEWPEIPAETPYLASYRKRAVCKDWMVGATGIEPVTPSMSTRCSPAELRALKP